jgi:protein-L-isoaspartate(D-aspartate) O-methyltransferase
MDASAANNANTDRGGLHQALVDKLKLAGHIRSEEVEAAFRSVPRHLFLPDFPVDEVYRDQVIPIKRLDGEFVSSSSQPTIMAIMLEQLDLQPGQRVLEIGAGSGYNAALIAQIVGESGQVVTIDIDEDIVEDACEHLKEAGFNWVQVVCGDGGLGYPAGAPYDRIILTVKAWDIAPAWFEQLKPGGRLLLPLTIIRETPKLVTFERVHNVLASISVEDCDFISLRGAFAGPESSVQLGVEQELYLTVEDPRSVNAELVYQLLTGPGRIWPTGVETTFRDVWGGLSLWLALHERCFCIVTAQGSVAKSGIVPPLYKFSETFSRTIGLLDNANLCVLMPLPDQSCSNSLAQYSSPFELCVRSYGQDDIFARHLVEQVKAWDIAGRPANIGLSIRAYPIDSNYAPSGNGFVIPKRWRWFALKWQ